MNLEQIRIDFIPEQDRLLMRLASGDRSEVLLWLTRRCVRLIWPLLIKMTESVPQIAQQPLPEARQALLGMQREQALSKANFSRPYDAANRERPLGADPIIVARVNTGRNDQGKHVLALLPQQGQGVTLGLDDTLLHGLCKLLQDVVAKAEWDMVLALPAQTQAAVHEAPRVLN
ncbi:MAG: hypothetical protein JWN94_4501 [Betaproteobacteria bacterium]|nr:hypothetical protein [Betaproteobacteria bacterium]